MPFIKSQQQKPAQWKTWEEDTFREGYRGAVFGSSNKEKYTGWYRKNVKHGKGFQTYDNDGSLTYYEGDWENDNRHGYGSLSFDCKATRKNLRIYSGEWRNDKITGFGMKSFPDGGQYKGDFKNGMRHGQGIMYYQDGTIYTGAWYKDKRHGVGRLVNNGDYYEGTFKNDEKCGLGRFHHISKGQLQEGIWKRNLPQVTTLFDDPDPGNRVDENTGMMKTQFEIPPLTILRNPQRLYLERAHEVLDEISQENSTQLRPENTSRILCNG